MAILAASLERHYAAQNIIIRVRCSRLTSLSYRLRKFNKFCMFRCNITGTSTVVHILFDYGRITKKWVRQHPRCSLMTLLLLLMMTTMYGAGLVNRTTDSFGTSLRCRGDRSEAFARWQRLRLLQLLFFALKDNNNTSSASKGPETK